MKKMMLWTWKFCFWTLPRMASWATGLHKWCFVVTTVWWPCPQPPPPSCFSCPSSLPHSSRRVAAGGGEPTAKGGSGGSRREDWSRALSTIAGNMFQTMAAFAASSSAVSYVGRVSLQCVEWMRIRKYVLAEFQLNNAKAFQVRACI